MRNRLNFKRLKSRSLILGFWFSFFLFFDARNVHAYPNTIGYGYGSCTTCHFNSNGNGPLTDYGRALFATAIAAKPWIQAFGKTDEELGSSSGFLGRLQLPSLIRPFMGFRGMALVSDIESGSLSTRVIPMDLHAGMVLKAFKDRVFLSGTAAYSPPPVGSSESDSPTWITREHILVVRPWKWLEVGAGLTDVAFGLRVPEHPAFIRSWNGLSMNDQSHGAWMTWSGRSGQLTVHGLTGNFLQAADLRQKGVSATGEIEVAEKIRLGASAMSTTNDYRGRLLGAIHSRIGFTEGTSVIAQVGVNRESPVLTSLDETLGETFFLQSTFLLKRGWNLLFSFEQGTRDVLSGVQYFRAGPTLQVFPMQRLEFRFDLVASRLMGAEQVDPDRIALQSQLHLSL